MTDVKAEGELAEARQVKINSKKELILALMDGIPNSYKVVVDFVEGAQDHDGTFCVSSVEINEDDEEVVLLLSPAD